MRRALYVLLGVLALAVLPVLRAGAHAFLDHANPAVGSTVRASPAQVRVWFTQHLEPAFSTVRVLDRSGKQVDNGESRVDTANATLLVVSLPALGPGTYKVIWRVLSVDAHVTEGDFTFDVSQ
jgi:methionine-rich copper-binding protein CopC